MAFIPAQLGAVTDRVRRFFGVRGPYSAAVDETISPVVQLQDLGQQPYDVNSERWIARGNITFAGTEPDYMVGVRNDTSSLVVLDRLLVSSNRTLSFGVGSEPFPGTVVDLQAKSRDLVSSNVGGFETGANLGPRNVGISVYHSQIGGSNRATTMFQMRNPTSLQVDLGMVLGVNMVGQLMMPPAIVAADYLVYALWGRIFADPSLNVTP